MHSLKLHLGLLRAGQNSCNTRTATFGPHVARAHCRPTVPKGSYFHTSLCQNLPPWPRTMLHMAVLSEV